MNTYKYQLNSDIYIRNMHYILGIKVRTQNQEEIERKSEKLD